MKTTEVLKHLIPDLTLKNSDSNPPRSGFPAPAANHCSVINGCWSQTTSWHVWAPTQLPEYFRGRQFFPLCLHTSSINWEKLKIKHNLQDSIENSLLRERHTERVGDKQKQREKSKEGRMRLLYMAVSSLSLARALWGREGGEALEGVVLLFLGHRSLSGQEGARSPAQEGYRMVPSLLGGPLAETHRMAKIWLPKSQILLRFPPLGFPVGTMERRINHRQTDSLYNVDSGRRNFLSLGGQGRPNVIPESIKDGEELSGDQKSTFFGYFEPQAHKWRAPWFYLILASSYSSHLLLLPLLLPVPFPFASPLFSFLSSPPLSWLFSSLTSNTYTESHLPQNAELRQIWSFLCCLNSLEPLDGVSELLEDSLYLWTKKELTYGWFCSAITHYWPRKALDNA